ncbi:MAG: protein kinase [Myxococcales bacterium]|nr:protein kinase [Myxococcales bacterium]
MSSRDGAAASSRAIDSLALVGRVLQERVRVDRVVAEGGFGVVYEGEHLSLGVRVAVKVLKRSLDEYESNGSDAPYVEHFLREARTIARIRHPNIVQVLDVATTTHEGEPLAYMVLEWCDGVSLDQWLDRRAERAMTPQEAWTVIGPVARAIAEAHEHGVAHRDLKPANVMMVEGKKGFVPMLLDFGIAKVMNGETAAGSGVTATDSTMRAYSPQYAAPEQVAGTRSGPWTDVHALALLFVELVLGTTAYKSDSRQWLLQEIMSPTRPTAARRGVALGALDPVLDRALAFLPEARHPNAHEFIAAVEDAFAKGVPAVKGQQEARPDGDEVIEPTIDVDSVAPKETGRRATSAKVPSVAAAPVAERVEPAPAAPVARESTPTATKRSSSKSVVLVALALSAIVAVFAVVNRSASREASQTREPPSPGVAPRPTPAAREPIAAREPTTTPSPSNTPPPPTLVVDAGIASAASTDSGIRAQRGTATRARGSASRGGYRLE